MILENVVSAFVVRNILRFNVTIITIHLISTLINTVSDDVQYVVYRNMRDASA